jgi:hypothetical protein
VNRLTILGVGAGLIAAVFAFCALERSVGRPRPTLVDTRAPASEVAPAPVETFEPIERPSPSEPAARPIEPQRAGAAPAQRPPLPPDDRERLDDAATLAKLHELAASDPEQSLRLAKEALQRFPNSDHAPELEWNVVKALVNMGRFDGAKDEARTMVRNYPGSEFSVDVERHLLHPQPNP